MSLSMRVAALAATALVGGCAQQESAFVSTSPYAEKSATDEQLADPQWWLDQPGQGQAAGAFETLWASAEKVSREYLFAIDRRDPRNGLLTTQPTISAQWFEPWRRELQSGSDIADSSIATYRRTIYFNFEKTGEEFTVVPKVLVERQALAERRVTGVLGKSYFRRAPGDEAAGTRETDAGVLLPSSYWYPVGRDYAFEQKLLEDLNATLK